LPKNYYVLIGGKKVSVDEDVYRAFMRPIWSAERRKRRHKESGMTFLSLDAFAEDGFEPASDERLVDEIVEDRMLLEMLYAALQELTDDERDLIDALFYRDETERSVAKKVGVSQNTINYRKKNVLDKLRKLIEKKM